MEETQALELIKMDEFVQFSNVFESDLMALETAEMSIQVSDEESAKQALSMALQSRKIKTAAIESKEKVMRPVLDYQKSINEIVSEFKQRIEAIEERLKGKISSWVENENNDNIFYRVNDLEVEDGKFYCKKVWSFDLENENSIPREYLTIDESKIKLAIKNGVRNIPGVKIYEKDEYTMRVKNS